MLLTHLALAALALQSAQAPRARNVVAPPEDFLSGRLRLPEPVVTRARGAWRDVLFRADERGGFAPCELAIAVEAPGQLALVALSPAATRWSLELSGPDGSRRWLTTDVPGAGVEVRVEEASSVFPGCEAVRYDLDVLHAGTWGVRVHAAAPGTTAPDGLLYVHGTGATLLESRLSSYELLADRPVGLVARLAGEAAVASGATIELAEMHVASERGSERVPLFDDGQHADGEPGDGLFGGALPPGVSGAVSVRLDVLGRAASGAPLARTALHAFPVLEPRAVLRGDARGTRWDERVLAIELGVEMLVGASKLQVAAEVWASAADGSWVPLCWLSRMAEPRAAVSGHVLELALPLDRLAGVRGPIELRHVRVQDPDTHVPFDALERVPLGFGPSRRTGPPESATSIPPPAPLRPSQPLGALMLVHGYCSGGSIWPGPDFSQPKVEFLDPSQNRTNDEFALLLKAFGEASGLYTFGVVAHSQGGMAALHLLTFYESGLDRAAGGRVIQSVATPYQGTPLASLGGFACGVNFDLTPDGAALWLAGIPDWARAEVHYWTTADDGSACNFLTDLFLADPNDGTVERFRGQLPGGNNQGHRTGWCHTTGMSDPPNYTDSSRNAEMDAQAAR